MNNLVGELKANPTDFYRYKIVKKKKKKKDRQGIPPLKKRGGNVVLELDTERAEELTGQFNDAFNKTEYVRFR